jgi:hypothetical protein
MTPSWPVLWWTVKPGALLGASARASQTGGTTSAIGDRVRGAQLADAYVHGRDAVAVDVAWRACSPAETSCCSRSWWVPRGKVFAGGGGSRGVAGALVDVDVDLVRVDLRGRELLADGVGALVLVGAERAGADQDEAVGEPAELLGGGLVQVAVEADLEAGDDQGAEVGLV